MISFKTQKFNDNFIKTLNPNQKNEDFEQARRNLKKAERKVQTVPNIQAIKIWRMKNDKEEFEEIAFQDISELQQNESSNDELSQNDFSGRNIGSYDHSQNSKTHSSKMSSSNLNFETVQEKTDNKEESKEDNESVISNFQGSEKSIMHSSQYN